MTELPIARSLAILLCVFALTFFVTRPATADTPAEASIVETMQEAPPTNDTVAASAVPDLSGFALAGMGGLMTVVFGFGLVAISQDEL